MAECWEADPVADPYVTAEQRSPSVPLSKLRTETVIQIKYRPRRTGR